jgi:hypothetical protein
LDVQESALFLRGSLDKGLYYGHKGKEHATEVVTTAEKLPLEDIKDNSGEAQSQQDDDKETRSRRQFQEGSEAGRRSRIRERLPAARAKKQPQKPRDTPKKPRSKDGLEREEKQLQKTS